MQWRKSKSECQIMKWIEVEKELPKDEVPVLCFHSFSGNYFVCYRTKDCLTGEPKWQGGAMPTHWQQLTTPELNEDEIIIAGLEEGSQFWKQEYDDCRNLLETLVHLKAYKDVHGKTELYLKQQPKAWEAAVKFLQDYQHLGG